MAFFHLPLSSLAAAVLVLLVAPETSWTMSLSVGHRPTLLQQRQQDADFDCARLPPAFWCSCEKVQAKCGFEKFCSAYEKASRGRPLQLTLLYESLCPDCERFIQQQLLPISVQFNGSIEIELVPFGNAQMQNGTVKCQHGQAECLANKLESCAIHFLQEPLPFIGCLEKLLASEMRLEKAVRKCYAATQQSQHIYDQINHCFNGVIGDRLQAEAAVRTEGVWPDQHEFVPWILINNASLQSAQPLLLGDGLTTLLCQSLELADDQPEVCRRMFVRSPFRHMVEASERRHQQQRALLIMNTEEEDTSSSSSSSTNTGSSMEEATEM